MINQHTTKANMYEPLPLFDKNALGASRYQRLMEEVKNKEHKALTGVLEKSIQTSNAKDDLIFALVRVASVLYLYGIEDADPKGRCRNSVSYFVRLKHNELLTNATEIIRTAKENSRQLKKSGVNASVLSDLQFKLEKFRNSLESKVLNFC